MKKFVVDASVAVKWFVPEIQSAAAERLLDPEIVLSAPDLILSELGNTLWKKVRRLEITSHEAEEIVTAFDSVPVEIYPSRALSPGSVPACRRARSERLRQHLCRTGRCAGVRARDCRPEAPFRTGNERVREAHPVDRRRALTHPRSCLP